MARRSRRFLPLRLGGAAGTVSSMRTISRMPTNCLSLALSGSSRHSSSFGTTVEQMVLQISATMWMLAPLVNLIRQDQVRQGVLTLIVHRILKKARIIVGYEMHDDT